MASFRADSRTPPALTAAVATAVLGTRLTLLGWTGAGIAGLVIALALWAALLRPVPAGWKSPTVGVSLVLAVAPNRSPCSLPRWQSPARALAADRRARAAGARALPVRHLAL
jgi:hypothetical protein